MSDFFVHRLALVESDQVGRGTRIWAYAHVMKDVVVGEECNIGDHAFLESGVRLGRGVTIKNAVLLWKGVELADYVFVGPNVVFTNDRYPRSPRHPVVAARYHDEANWLVRTKVEEGAAIGAQATIICGVTLGAYCVVAAGSVVTRDVPPFALVAGNPARWRGYVDRSGRPLVEKDGGWENPVTGTRYQYHNNVMEEIEH
jgi:UDP-2-acetamido-3-amino-2,3-dideoxy-glucuronate N-acetyltransferase